MNIRLDFMNLLSFIAAAMLALQGKDHLSAAIVGMAINYALNVSCFIHHMFVNDETSEIASSLVLLIHMRVNSLISVIKSMSHSIEIC